MRQFVSVLCLIFGVCAIVYWILQLLPFPPQVKNIFLAILLLIMLVWILYAVGAIGPAWRVHLGAVSAPASQLGIAILQLGRL